MGRRTKEGPVIYIAGEGGEENVAHRARAALAEWTVDVDEEKALPFYIVTPGIDLVKGGRELADLIGWEPKEMPVLVVVDTLSRCFTGDENKQEFMAEFVKTLDHIRDHYRCDVLIVHHANKQHEVRGSSVLFGAVDVSWHLIGSPVANNEKAITMVADKLKERDSEGATLKIRGVKKNLIGPEGRKIYDEFGDEGTTLVIKPNKEDIDHATEIRDNALGIIEAGNGSVSYSTLRALFPKMSKAKFDAGLSFVVTYPGKWGIMRGINLGTYVKAVPGIENRWSRMA